MLGYRFGPLEWRGYRIETEVVDEADGTALGRAPDGIPFSWVYTPWPDTPVCRTTDFGVIHHGPERGADPAVVLREIVDDSVSMYPGLVGGRALLPLPRGGDANPSVVIPLGRLGLYKYVTMDSTLAMAQRLVHAARELPRREAGERFEILREIRGDWDE